MNVSDPYIKIVEVGPRDGLQSIQTYVPTSVKVEYINKLTRSHVPEIEITGFVSPKWIPQLSDASDVCNNINKSKQIIYTALVPNLKGAEMAVENGIKSISVITTTSESFSLNNTNCSISESINRLYEIDEFAKENDISVRVYISNCWDCPFEGKISVEQVKMILDKLIKKMTFREFVLSDTTGNASPANIKDLLMVLFTEFNPSSFALHLHDTFGHASENLRCGLDNGITTFDSSAGGIGGCPYSPGAKGNISTDTILSIIREAGYSTEVDEKKVYDAGHFINSYLTKN